MFISPHVTSLPHPSQQAAILEDLVRDVPVEFDFLFSSSHAEVISGKQEGETESCEPDGNRVQLYLDTDRFLGSHIQTVFMLD